MSGAPFSSPGLWSPNSGLAAFDLAVNEYNTDQVDDLISNDMLKGYKASPRLQSLKTESSPRKQPPSSPGIDLLLEAAADVMPNALNTPRSIHLALAAPSPGALGLSPARMLFYPNQVPESNLSPGQGLSPARGDLLDNYTESCFESPDLIGSIWKRPEQSSLRMNEKSTARRPLYGPDSEGEVTFKHATEDAAGRKVAQGPAGSAEPAVQRKRVSAKKSKGKGKEDGTAGDEDGARPRKDRKAYSTAGRPRVRGEYKCGKCGFMPKKAKHDCDAYRAQMLAQKARSDESKDDAPRPAKRSKNM